MSTFLIYGLVDPRTQAVRYIGKSESGLKRPRSHLAPSNLSRRNYKAAWLRGIVSEGLAPQIVVLEEFSSAVDLNDAECFWIAQAHGLGWKLTNLTNGGEGVSGRVASEETRARLTASNRARGGGWKLSDETVSRIAAASKARMTPEALATLARANQTSEARAKRSASLAGHGVTHETRRKISAALRGRKASSISRARMAASQTGKKQSPETVAKRAAALRAFHQRRQAAEGAV